MGARKTGQLGRAVGLERSIRKRTAARQSLLDFYELIARAMPTTAASASSKTNRPVALTNPVVRRVRLQTTWESRPAMAGPPCSSLERLVQNGAWKHSQRLLRCVAVLLALELRAPWEFGAVLPAWPVLQRAPLGDGPRVIVFPGPTAGDGTIIPLRLPGFAQLSPAGLGPGPGPGPEPGPARWCAGDHQAPTGWTCAVPHPTCYAPYQRALAQPQAAADNPAVAA